MTQRKASRNKGGFQQEPLGGRWEGESRSKKKATVTMARAMPDPGFSWSGLPVDLLVLLLALVVSVLGFSIVSSFLAEATGENWMLALLSILVALALPAGIAFWAVRPLHRRRAYHWWLGVFTAPYLLATVALCLAAPARTATMVRWHAAWPARLLAKGSNAEKTMQAVADRIAALLAGLPKGGGSVSPPPSTQDKIVSPPPPPPAYLGRIRPGHSQWTIPEDFGRRKGKKVVLKRKSGQWVLTAQATKANKPLSLVLDPHRPWTVLTNEAAARLGLPIPKRGASIEMRGEDRPVILLDRFFLASEKADNVAVVLCSECVPVGLSGVLGRNLLRHYHVSMDSTKGRLTVATATRGRSLPEDVDAFVLLEKITARNKDDSVLITGQARNLAPLPIEGLVVTLTFHDAADHVTGTHEIPVGRISAHGKNGIKRFEKELSPSKTTSGFRLKVTAGRWNPNAATRRRRHRHRRHGGGRNRRQARGGPASSR